MGHYRLPSGRLVFANSAAPRLPRSIASRLAGVVGLNNLAQMRPHLARMRSHAPVPVGGGGSIGSGPLGGLSPNDIKYAYSLDSITPLYGTTTPVPAGALDGTGQSIGLFELDGYAPADIAQYAAQFSLPAVLTGAAASVTVTPILLGGFSGTPIATPGQGGQTEVTLDIDMALALAPAATGIYVYEDDQTVDPVAPITIFTRMANDIAPGGTKPLLQVISCSWGLAEELETPDIIQAENTLFQKMAAQGQSVFCASGDYGAYDLYDPTLPALTSPAVDNPSSQPFATGVGGTTLSYAKPSPATGTGTGTGTGVGAGTGTGTGTGTTTGKYIGEIVWSAGTASINPEGSGGGISSIWPKPNYQLGAGASPTRRDVPDVALNADPNVGYSIFVGGAAEVVGGTSAAAPLWAAYTSLINEQRGVNGLGSLGFLNPLIYPIAAGSSASADLHDIVSGSNLFYQAGPGYDDATGNGSFIGAPLLAALSFNPNQGAGTATLTGFVTDSSSPALPVVGATVSAVSTATGAVVGTAITDATGAYTLTVPGGLALNLTVSVTGITAPTESLTGQTVAIAALTADQSVAEPTIMLAAANIYAAGIQMISAPFDFTGLGDFAAVFGLTEDQANRSPRLIQFSPLLNSYVFYPTAPADTLRLGQGYWVQFPSTEYIHIQGTSAPTTQPFSIRLQQGWNQIGDPFTIAAPLNTITVIKADGATEGPLASSNVVQTTLYGYNPSNNKYVALSDSTDSLQPYVGYWVFSSQASTLSVPSPGPPSGPPTAPVSFGG